MRRQTALTIAVMAIATSLTSIQPALADPKEPIVVSGHVVDAAGNPVSNARATLVAWPRMTKNQKEGDRIKLLPVSSMTTGDDGTFTATLKDSRQLRSMIDTDGSLDLDVLVRKGAKQGVYSTTVLVQTGDTEGDITSHSAKNTKLTTEEDVRVAVTEQGGDSSSPAGPAGEATAASESLDETPPMPKVCQTTVGPSKTPYVLTGSLYSTWSGFKGSYTYTSSASSTLGVGYSVTSPYSNVKQSGTLTKSSTQTYSWPKSGVFYLYFKPQWKYTEFTVNCFDGWVDTYNYSWKPMYATGGATTYSFSGAPSTPSGNCVWQSGYTYSTQSQDGMTWSNGVGLGGDIGVNLSSDTNWSANNDITISTTAGHHLCGTKDVPGGNFGELVARP